MPVKIKANRVLCAIALLLSLPTTVKAQQSTAFKDSAGRIFLYGMTPNTRVGVGVTGDISKTIQANSCGIVIVKGTSNFPLGIFSIDGQTVNPTAISDVRQLSDTCSAMSNYPQVFKTSLGEVAIKKTPLTPYTVIFPNHKVTRQVLVNSCGYAVLKNTNISTLNLPTATGGRADFSYPNLPIAQPLSCTKGTLYFASGFDAQKAIAFSSRRYANGTAQSAIANSTVQSAIATVATTTTSSTTATTTTTTTNTTTAAQQSTSSTGGTSTVSSQTAQPKAAKSGSKLIVSSIPPGTYTVSNFSNPQQSKVYTVTGKGCLVSDITQIGSPSKFLISRQGLTFPIDWASLTEVPAATIPQC